ncbi:hypothetical protein M378DRAFT_381418 [Amanita muscaria Koide BX008]|uniref:Uncharacterized protein n=1 Tax=Amanita muscaria (strain Koide BX008) TaxID=946122 RepID=A0A0C2WMU0_AMAMK|nr:hypothetical protein M378DRAFT_381418 [Amanita muscaria Koide BX008]
MYVGFSGRPCPSRMDHLRLPYPPSICATSLKPRITVKFQIGCRLIAGLMDHERMSQDEPPMNRGQG